MILTTEDRQVQSNLTGVSRSFTIAATGHAFRTLVAGIYSDKIQSVIRELTSNAFDAHTVAGNTDKPFEVRLPNALSPEFSVRDFGCGMTDEVVMGVYSTLFDSSKRDDNSQVGAFGLGAKAFLSITDACILRCYLDGVCRVYQINLDQAGIPTVTLVNEAPSDQPRGTEVSFAVSPGEFGKFSDAFNEVALGFDVAPIILGSETSIPKPVSVGDGWRMFTGSKGSRVRQGCAIYPMPGSISVNLPYNHWVILDMPIGSVSVTASRESLALTNAEYPVLRDALENVLADIRRGHIEAYGKLKTDIERAHYAYAFRSILGNSAAYPSHVKLTDSLLQNKSGGEYDVFNIDSISRMMLILDDGAKVIRRIRRLKALEASRVVHITKDREVFDRSRIALGLTADRAMPISDIPDVYTAPRGTGAGTDRASAPRKNITTGRIWCISVNGQATCFDQATNVRIGSWTTGSKVKTSNRYSHSANLLGIRDPKWVNELLGTEEVLYLTTAEAERALKAGKIVAERNLFNIVKDYLSTADVKTKVRNDIIYKNINRFSSSEATRVMISRISLGTCINSPSISSISEAMFPTDHTENMRIATGITRSLRSQYPLLFTQDGDTMTAYMAERDAQREAQEAIAAQDQIKI